MSANYCGSEVVLTTFMLIFGKIIVKSKKKNHFYILSEQIPIIAIINNKKKIRTKLCSMNKTLVGTEESARGVNQRCSVNKVF